MLKKVREAQLVVRVAAPLRGELEAEAAEDSRDLSSLVRKILIAHAAERAVARARSEGVAA